MPSAALGPDLAEFTDALCDVVNLRCDRYELLLAAAEKSCHRR